MGIKLTGLSQITHIRGLNTNFHNKRSQNSSLSTWLVSRGSRSTIRLCFRILSFSLIGDISYITTISIDRVGNLLQATIRKGDIVSTGGGVSVPLFISSVVIAGVVILHGVGVGVLGRLVGVSRGGSTVGRWRGVWAGKGHDSKQRDSEEALEREGWIRIHDSILIFIPICC